MLVLDASVALAVLLDQPQAPQAERVILRMGAEPAHVPAHWALELANVMAREARRGALEPLRVEALLRQVSSWPLIVDGETPARAFGPTLELAIGRGLTVYDAAYLELCLRLGAPLATFDAALAKAAQACGVALLSEGS